jgi:hypothetical protein
MDVALVPLGRRGFDVVSPHAIGPRRIDDCCVFERVDLLDFGLSAVDEALASGGCAPVSRLGLERAARLDTDRRDVRASNQPLTDPQPGEVAA